MKPNKAKESLREHYDLAVLSKTLATINTDSPLEFAYEEARLQDLYTPEAYELCKRLEFKNLLSRFDAASVSQQTMTDDFFTCEDLSGAEALFQKAAAKPYVGVELLCDREDVYGVGIALEEEEVYHIPAQGLMTGDYLCGKLKELADTTVLCCMDVKSVLKHVKLTETSHVQESVYIF